MQVNVSSDGRHLRCDPPNVDVTRAFDQSDEDREPPIDMIQRAMAPVTRSSDALSRSTNLISNRSTSNGDLQKTVHLPNFISIANDLFDNESCTVNDQRLLHVCARRTSLKNDEQNERLLRERANNPCDLKWQITPLIEARIFHCTGEEG